MASKLAQTSAQQFEDMEMDMSPMIDMVFLLLIFFMVSSTMITNRLDPKVDIPLGGKSQPPDVIAGRVVINIYEDGTFYDEKSEPLADADAIIDYVNQKKRVHELDGDITRILIRGDLGCDVEMVKRVVKASADAGVTDVIFAAYQTKRGL